MRSYELFLMNLAKKKILIQFELAFRIMPHSLRKISLDTNQYCDLFISSCLHLILNIHILTSFLFCPFRYQAMFFHFFLGLNIISVHVVCSKIK